MAYDFDEDFQLRIAAFLLRDEIFCNTTDGLIKAEYFTNEGVAALVHLHLDYWHKYKGTMPNVVLAREIKNAVATKVIRGDTIDHVKKAAIAISKADLSARAYVTDAISEFAKTQALEAALLASVDLLDKRDFTKISELMSSAVLVGADFEVADYDPFEQLEGRLDHRINLKSGAIKPDGITSGHHDIDVALMPHRGWGRKELTVVQGGAKSGKSTALLHFGINAARAGYNVLFATCEVSAKIIANRFDANISGVDVNDLPNKTTEVDAKVTAFKATSGHFKIAEYASGTCTTQMLRRKINRYRQKGIIFDVIIVDYADIMTTERKYDQERFKLSEIYLGLRAIAFDENAAVLTATQGTRTGQKKAMSSVMDETDVAEDFNKARHCDVMFSINATEQEKADKELRLYFALVRNDESGFSLRYNTDRAKMRFLTHFIGRVL